MTPDGFSGMSYPLILPWQPLTSTRVNPDAIRSRDVTTRVTSQLITATKVACVSQ